MRTFSYILLSILFSLSWSQSAYAEPFLTVAGTSDKGEDLVLEYSIEQLLALDQHEIQTANDFVNEVHVFSGPLMRDLFADFSLKNAETISLTALNDYRTSFPLAEVFDYDVIIALSMSGKRLTMRDKGPMWVIYPMDEYKILRNPIYNSRLVWQLKSVELE